MVTSTTGAPWPWLGGALMLASAVECWPAGPGRHRLAAMFPRHRAAAPPWARRLPHWVTEGPTQPVLALAAAALLGGLVAGVGGAIAASMLAGLALHRRRGAARRRRMDAERAALVEALGVMTTELRAGAHPANAAADAATGAEAVHRMFASVSAGARLGADVPALLARHATGASAIPDELGRLAAAWGLAERHGVALAELLTAVRADLEARVRLAGQVTAQLAGPKASAAVLAGLPLLGIALGQGIGANPWRVLTATPLGQLLLIVGTALACAGVIWSGRIMSKAVPK